MHTSKLDELASLAKPACRAASFFFTGGGRTMCAATANLKIRQCARPCGGNSWRQTASARNGAPKVKA